MPSGFKLNSTTLKYNGIEEPEAWLDFFVGSLFVRVLFSCCASSPAAVDFVLRDVIGRVSSSATAPVVVVVAIVFLVLAGALAPIVADVVVVG